MKEKIKAFFSLNHQLALIDKKPDTDSLYHIYFILSFLKHFQKQEVEHYLSGKTKDKPKTAIMKGFMLAASFDKAILFTLSALSLLFTKELFMSMAHNEIIYTSLLYMCFSGIVPSLYTGLLMLVRSEYTSYSILYNLKDEEFLAKINKKILSSQIQTSVKNTNVQKKNRL